MNSPLFCLTIFHIAGILFSRFVPIDTGIMICCCAGMILAGIRVRSNRISNWLLSGCIFLLGAIGFNIQSQPISPADLRHQLPQFETIATVSGVVLEVMNPDERSPEFGENKKPRRILLEAHRIASQISPESGRARGVIEVLISQSGMDGLSSLPEPGDRIEAHGVASPLAPPMNMHARDFRPYLRSRGCHFTLRVGFHGWIRYSGPPLKKSLPERVAANIRAAASQLVAAHFPLDDRERRLLYAIGLGMRESLLRSDTDSFRLTGTMHLFAVSGLHVGLVAVIFFRGMQFFVWDRRIAAILCIPAIWIYALITGMPPSATRAAFMASVVFAGMCVERPDHWPNTLHLTILAHLLLDPGQLFQPGFLLSFTAVFWIILIMPGTRCFVQKISTPDPLLPRELTPVWKIYMHRALGYIVSLLLLSIVCWGGTAPVNALTFGYITWTGLMLNIVLVPLAGLTLLGLVLGWTFSWIHSAIDGSFFHAAWASMWIMTCIADIFSTIPGSTLRPANNHIIYWSCFCLSAIAMAFSFTRRSTGFTAIVRLLSTTTLLLLVILFFVPVSRMEKVDTFHSLARSGSHVILHQPRDREKTLVMNCGSTNVFNFIQPVLEQYPVGDLLLTHASSRQMGATELFLPMWNPTPTVFANTRDKFRSPPWTRLINKSNANPTEVQVRDLHAFGEAYADFRILWPGEESSELLPLSKASDLSTVLLWNNGTHSLLICPPLSPEAQMAILNDSGSGSVRPDGIISTIDEFRFPLEPWFVRHFDPQWILVADSPFPQDRNFSDHSLHHWKQKFSPALVIRQSDHGDFRLSAGPSSWSLTSPNHSITIPLR